MAGRASYGIGILEPAEASEVHHFLSELAEILSDGNTAWDAFCKELEPQMKLAGRRYVASISTRFIDSSAACWSEVKLKKGEKIFTSVTQTGVLVLKKGWILNSKLFEGNVVESGRTYQRLAERYPEAEGLCPSGIKTPALRAFTNAALHCAKSKELRAVLNEA